MKLSALEILSQALEEDAPEGDVTCLALSKLCANIHHRSCGTILAKQDLVFSGEEFLVALRELPQRAALRAPISTTLFYHDGDSIKKGDKMATLQGHYSDLLLVERTLLNILGRLCGIATLTQKFVSEVAHTPCKILDTRKTTPLLRTFEKNAVVHGGGQNHRMNLSDAIMLKENHLKTTDLDIKTLVNQIKELYPRKKIILEVENEEQLEQALTSKVDQILLDNMTTEQIATCVKKFPPHIKSEASGNMNLERVRGVAETGVQFISIGLITHSVPCADISFLLD
ncbi:MAG: carboxylating nicotinate-nucleotide diphosphorylase [Bdellovibrionaceae bacterium]|nr:carboxylating nicotinate-nucleotide diphosphorylase [Pseudobdellovibrionaceae bacterium]